MQQLSAFGILGGVKSACEIVLLAVMASAGCSGSEAGANDGGPVKSDGLAATFDSCVATRKNDAEPLQSPCAQDPVAGAASYLSNGYWFVVCTAKEKRTQCEAEQLCNVYAGWELCPASKYRIGFGWHKNDESAFPAAFGEHWIKGCVRDRAGSYLPKDKVCGECDQPAATVKEPVQWGNCDEKVLDQETQGTHVGLRAKNACRKVVEDKGVQTQSLWVPEATAELHQAICCKRVCGAK